MVPMGNKQKNSRVSEKIDKKLILYFLVIFSVSLIVFWPNFNYYFFRDDWFLLNWVNSSTFYSLLNVRTDIIYWRPISLPIFFWINYKMFGIDSTIFHLFSLTIFSTLIISTYILLKKLIKDNKSALITTLFYATWPIHFISLGWLAATQYIIAPVFGLLSFILFIKFIENAKYKSLILCNSFYILGLLSHESIIILPALIFIWGFILKRSNYLQPLSPMIIVSVIYVLFRIIIFLPNLSNEYNIAFNNTPIINLAWYVLWALNLPESFKELVNINMPNQSFIIYQSI